MPSYLAPINLNKLELQNARVQNLASAPGTPVAGQLYYDTGTNKLMWWNGSTWVAAEPGTPTLVYATTADLADVDAAAESAGVIANIARGDHKHALSVGAPGASSVGDTVSNGVATSAARSDHRHSREAFGTVTADTSFGAAQADGSATTVARSDHSHGSPAHLAAAHSAITVSNLAAPTADVAWAGFKITNLGTPTAGTDAANKQYVDDVAAGIAWKDTVRAATTAAGTLASSFANGQTIDGVTLATNDRILIKNQAAGQENGIYFVNAAGAPTRVLDADTVQEILQAAVFVQDGTTNADTGWVMTTNLPITLNTTPLTFVQFTGAASITAGNGLTQTGNSIDVVAGTGMVANANDVAVLRTDTNGRVPLKYAANYGDGAATAYNIDHNLNSLDVIVQVFTVATGVEVEVDKTRSTVNRVILTHAVAPATNAYRVVVYG
jgi:hypothetical protein